jgi:hypothetical protein
MMRVSGPWLKLYWAMALFTFGFQLWVRIDQCMTPDDCKSSFAKAIVWATIWPASWAVYLVGLLPGLGS